MVPRNAPRIPNPSRGRPRARLPARERNSEDDSQRFTDEGFTSESGRRVGDRARSAVGRAMRGVAPRRGAFGSTLGAGLEDPLRAEPFLTTLRPTRARLAGGPEAEAVA